MTLTPGRVIADCTAALISDAAPVAATTSTILAPGAIACAHCTSSEVSMAHITSSFCASLKTGQPSVGHTMVKLGGSGMANVRSNIAKSEVLKSGDVVGTIVGLPYASTIAIVCPVPSKVIPAKVAE